MDGYCCPRYSRTPVPHVNPSPAAAEMLSIEQDPLVDGLGEIRGGAGRTPASFGFPVVTSSDDDDRHPHVGLGQPPLNVGAGHSRHVEIEDRAIGTVRRHRIDEVLPGSERRHGGPARREQPLEGFANGPIIVDDGDARIPPLCGLYDVRRSLATGYSRRRTVRPSSAVHGTNSV